MFEKGIIDPNENSLAQAEFFAKEDLNINLDLSTYTTLAHKNEADTRKALSLCDYEAAFISSMKWMQDYRFEHRPIEFAFGISCDYLKKYDYAIEIVKAFIRSNPKDPAAVNNLVYALGLSNRIEEAERELLKIDLKQYKAGNTKNSICLLATCGLIEYRKGDIETGRKLYNTSIAAAKKCSDKEQGNKLAAKARLNMIREEIRAVDDYDEKLLNELDDLNTGSKVETEQLKKDILEEVKKKN
jgi:tetratricopeptide (TPR) repeat protein